MTSPFVSLTVTDVTESAFFCLYLYNFNIIINVVNYKDVTKITVQLSNRLLHCADCGEVPHMKHCR
jgi:hypothetical protein